MSEQEKKPPRRVTICTVKGFEEELKYLKQQPNQSFYIWNLIREDKRRKDEDKEIIKIVREAVQNISIQPPQPQKSFSSNTKEKMDASNFEPNKLKKSALSILTD